MDITDKRHVPSLRITPHPSLTPGTVVRVIHMLTHAERTSDGASRNQPAFFCCSKDIALTECFLTHQEYKETIRCTQLKKRGVCLSALLTCSQIQSPATGLDSAPHVTHSIPYVSLGPRGWEGHNQGVSDSATLYLNVGLISFSFSSTGLSPKEPPKVKSVRRVYTY